jgi:hypothetical protein
LRLARDAVVTRDELDAADLDAEDLLRARIIERMDGARWRPPDCEQVCTPNLDLESRRRDGLVGVACPNEPACWPGWQWVPAKALEDYRCPAARVFAALRERNGLEPLDAGLEPAIVPVGILARRGRRIPVVWMLQPDDPFDAICSGLAHRLAGDGLIVLLSRLGGQIPDVCRPGGIVVLEVPETRDGDLALWRALDAIDPHYRRVRIDDPAALFDDVTMEFATVPGERHVVRINGHDCGGFRISDIKFARLLLLAAARAGDADTEAGGWIEKWRLLGDDKDHDIEALRRELESHPVNGLSAAEMKSLIKSSPTRDGRIRLALDPRHVRFDESLRSLRFVGENRTKPKSGRKESTPGARQLARNLEKARKNAGTLLKKARELGAPVPLNLEG